MRLTYQIDPQFDANERSIIREGLGIWERGTNGRVCFQEGGDDIEITRLEHQIELKPHDDEWQNHVALCKGRHIWIVAPKLEERGEYLSLVVHEVGHRIGLHHIEDTSMTFMHSAINDTPHELWETPELPERDRKEFCTVHSCTCRW